MKNMLKKKQDNSTQKICNCYRVFLLDTEDM